MKTASLAFLALVLLAPVRAEEPKAAPAAQGPRIAVEPAGFDFGKALQHRSLTKEFSIRNFGNADLVIEAVASSCGCTAALLRDKDKIVKPGGSAPLRVELQTRAFEGKVAKTVLIRSNDAQRRTYELKVEATVVKGE
ncbi:MAG: DUF1573 domain-containing protein [Acidobacteria bacterium]|nr:DUF1573 domain-containing protein [Acidobacteriota bacterium]